MSTVLRLPTTFTDDFARALHRETSWPVPPAERRTCDEHGDWRANCAHLHKEAA